MSLKTIFIALILLLPYSVSAKERNVRPQSDLSFICPAEDPVCTEIETIPKTGSVFETMKLERVIDGDTFIASGRKIRLWGINAPEKNTPAYTAASWLLQSLVKEGELSCKLVDIDKYKREVMHCLIDGLDIGAMMVKMGMAKDYQKYSGGYYQKEQTEAKTQKRGIWKLYPKE